MVRGPTKVADGVEVPLAHIEFAVAAYWIDPTATSLLLSALHAPLAATDPTEVAQLPSENMLTVPAEQVVVTVQWVQVEHARTMSSSTR